MPFKYLEAFFYIHISNSIPHDLNWQPALQNIIGKIIGYIYYVDWKHRQEQGKRRVVERFYKCLQDSLYYIPICKGVDHPHP